MLGVNTQTLGPKAATFASGQSEVAAGAVLAVDTVLADGAAAAAPADTATMPAASAAEAKSALNLRIR
jgi:hypothetical protein